MTVVLRALMLALLIALVLPALARADDAPTAVLDPPAAGQTTPVAETPQAEDPAPGPVGQDPAAEPPVVEPEPTAPPATGTTEPVVEAPVEPVLPPEGEVVPVPAPVTPDVVITTPELVATPAVPPANPPARLLPVVVIPPSNADAVPGRLSGAATAATVNLPPAPPPVRSITLAADTDTPVMPSPAAGEPGRARPSDAALKGLLTRSSALPQNLFSLDLNADRDRSPVAAVDATPIERGPGVGLDEEGQSTLFSESVAAPVGTVGSGSSLLAVLAGYVLPGVGGPPASTLIMFVLVGLIVAIARAPRPQLSERLHMGALLGAASGHGLAVCRPG